MFDPSDHIFDAVPSEQLRTTAEPCQIHLVHRPLSHQNHIHHIWPKGMGGPNIPENTVISCATGHFSIHLILKEWVRLDGKPDKSFLKTYTRGERKYAEMGYRRFKAKAIV